MRHAIDIIIVNWNSGNQLSDCVYSVILHGQFMIARIIVVDNGSTDGSANAVEYLPNVTLIRAGENLGFGKACNLGASHSDSEFLLFLNPDARVFPETLSVVLSFMQRPENEKVGICGVQLVNEAGFISRSCARFPSAVNLFVHAVGLDRIFARLSYIMTEWDHAATREVDHIIGAFLFVRRSLFSALQGFDAQFFMYLEDMDFSKRAKGFGWSTVFLAKSQAFHAGGGTSRQVKSRRLFYSLRSRILYSFKHFSPIAASIVLITSLLLEPLSRSALAVSKRSWSSLKETWSAYAMLYRWLPDWLFRGKVH